MTQESVPCPEARWGGARECAHCPREIPIGAPALQNEFSAFVHPECIDVVTGAFGIKRPAPPGTQAAPSTLTGDALDETAAAMDRLFGVPGARDESAGITATVPLDPSDPVDATAAAMDRLFGKVGG